MRLFRLFLLCPVLLALAIPSFSQDSTKSESLQERSRARKTVKLEGTRPAPRVDAIDSGPRHWAEDDPATFSFVAGKDKGAHIVDHRNETVQTELTGPSFVNSMSSRGFQREQEYKAMQRDAATAKDAARESNKDSAPDGAETPAPAPAPGVAPPPPPRN